MKLGLGSTSSQKLIAVASNVNVPLRRVFELNYNIDWFFNCNFVKAVMNHTLVHKNAIKLLCFAK